MDVSGTWWHVAASSLCALREDIETTFFVKARVGILGFREELWRRMAEECDHFCEVVDNGVLSRHWVGSIEQVTVLEHVPDPNER